MGVSEDVTVDSTVGTIVWVRRRNGSWWPGRILGQEELSATHLMSPRSGTPVKLLGREDASVDWYNLEKSKRVKAFRCGEFNECIKKAEAAQGGPAKKREKYARREDAILHALELEKEQLAGKQLKTAVVSTSLNDKRPSTVKDELEHSSHIESVSRGDGMKGTSRYASTKSSSRKPHSALKDDFKYGSSTSRKGRQPIQESGDEDNGEIIPRMRGLQDFGLKSASSKRKQSIPMGFESSQRNPADGSLMYDCPSVRGIDSLSQLSIPPNCNGMKRKKFHSGAGEELNVKRRDRRRPLVQVLQNTAKLSDYKASHAENGILPISLQGERDHATHMGSSQGRNSLSSPYDGDVNGYLGHAHRRHSVFGPDSSLLYNDRLAEERVDDEGDSGSSPESEEANELVPVPGAGNVGRNARYGSPLPGVKWDRQNPNSEEFDNDSPTYESLVHHLEQGGADGPDGVSKWQLKRKRNIRNLSRKHLDMPDGGDGDFSEDRLTHSSGVGFHHKRDRGLQSSYYHGDALDEMDPDGNTKLAVLRHSSLGIPFREQQRYGDNDSESDDDPRFVSPSSYEGRHHRNFSSALKSRAWLAEEPLGYWVESDDYLGPPRFYPPEAEPLYDEQGSMLDSMLFDVDLKVNASYQGEHVPLVSLMSRLNGKAIIGHPVPVEVMEDGYSEFLLREAAALQEGSTAKDDNSTLPPVWRTGRRTAMQRVPRPKSLPQENENITRYSSPDMKPPSKRSDAGNANDKKNKKGIQAYKKHLEKSKKASLFNQKTRTLSSFAADGKLNNIDASREGFSKVVDPVVKCIPVTAVFNRLRESLGISQGAAISVKETATIVPKEGDKIT